jgi:hypothetical protein
MRKVKAPPNGPRTAPVPDGILESPFFCLYDYTEAQWDTIKKTLSTPATPGAMTPGAMERACYDLRNSACVYLLGQNRPADKTKNMAELWRKVAQRVSDLMTSLQELPYNEWVTEHEALIDLFEMAVSRSADELEKQPKIKPRVLKPKARYQFELLDIWTSLGGGLGIAHGDPENGTKVTGPLSRYFAASAGPVCGGSLQTLKDITKNYKDAIRDGTWRQWWWRNWSWRRRREAQG